jgi:hypothetical protein
MNKRKRYDEMEILLEEYQDKFNENFPFFLVQDATDKQLIKLLKTAIKLNRKYTSDMGKDILF